MNSLLTVTGYHELKSHFKESLIPREKKMRVKNAPSSSGIFLWVFTFSAGEELVVLQEKNQIYYRVVGSFFQIQKLLEVRTPFK